MDPFALIYKALLRVYNSGKLKLLLTLWGSL